MIAGLVAASWYGSRGNAGVATSVPGANVQAALRTFAGILLFASIFLGTTSSHASLIGVSGDVDVIDAPASVRAGSLQSNTTAFVFEEKKGVSYPGFDALVSSQAAVDSGLSFLSDYSDEETFPGYLQVQSGLTDAYSDNVAARPPDGVRMDSYFLHFEPIPNVDGLPVYIATGTLSFDSEILGTQFGEVSYLPAEIELSTLMFKAENTSYNSFFSLAGGALELSSECGDFGDNYSISSDRRSLTFCFSANGNSDQLRIVTRSTVPEPATLTLLALGLVGIGARRRSNNGNVRLAGGAVA